MVGSSNNPGTGKQSWRYIGALVLGGGSLLCSGCTRWVEVRFDQAPSAAVEWEESRVTYEDGQQVELDKSRLVYPLLYGEVRSVRESAKGRVLRRADWNIRPPINVRRVARLERRQFSLEDTLIEGTGILLGVGSLVGLGVGFVWLVAHYAAPPI